MNSGKYKAARIGHFKCNKQFQRIDFLKNSIFHILVQILTSGQTIFNFLILGKYRFPPKKFYNINFSNETLGEKLWCLLFLLLKELYIIGRQCSRTFTKAPPLEHIRYLVAIGTYTTQLSTINKQSSAVVFAQIASFRFVFVLT